MKSNSRPILNIVLLFISWLLLFFIATVESNLKQTKKHHVAGIAGDIILGGLFPVHTSGSSTCDSINPERGIQRVEAMLFTLDEINNNSKILPRLQLGTVIRDTCSDTNYALEQALQYVQGNPFFGSNIEGHTMAAHVQPSSNMLTRGVVGSSYSSVSILVANLFRLFSLPQISYASTSAILSDKRTFPLFARTVPSDVVQARTMAYLVSAYNWTYVSTVRSSGDYGDSGMDAFWKEANKLGICIAAREVIRSNFDSKDLDTIVKILSKDFAKARVVVMFTGMDHTKLLLDAVKRAGLVDHFVWIASDGWGRENIPVTNNSREANGALTIEIQAQPISKFTDYYLSLGRDNPRNPWFKEYWQELTRCTPQQNKRRSAKRHIVTKSAKKVSGNWNTDNNDMASDDYVESRCLNEANLTLRDLLGTDFKQEAKVQFIYDAVYAFATGLHVLQRTLCPGDPFHASWNKHACVEKLLNYSGMDFYELIINTSFSDNYGNYVAFDENGDGYGQYSIYNYARDPYTGQYNYRLVGDFQGDKLTMRARPIWPGGQSSVLPVSQCSEECGFGEIRRLDKKQQCCWSCEACGVNQIIFNVTQCESCPFQHWPSENKTTCILLSLHFIDLSSWFAILPMTIGSVGILVTIGVVITWHIYSETPLVRATGRELAYVQLAGCIICYATPFVLLATPSILTCTLQRILIGLGFAMMYASLLTKTNRIARIFDAAKHTTKRPVFISPRSQLAIVGSLIALQLCMSAIWFGFDTPDTRIEELRPGFLIIRCAIKDKSFLISLAYNVILIVVCTAYAIKTRQIPENFNESKFIGFAMYTTCIIWLAFLTIYYATINNHQIQITTLCVSICLSASVVLCCLFFPKMYIIYFHPEENVKRLTMNKNMNAKQKFAQLIKQTASEHVSQSATAANPHPNLIFVNKDSMSTDNDKLDKSSANIRTSNSNQTSTDQYCQRPLFQTKDVENSSLSTTSSQKMNCTSNSARPLSPTPAPSTTPSTVPPKPATTKQSPTAIRSLVKSSNAANQNLTTHMSAPTPLFLDNIPNCLKLYSVYCADEDNGDNETDDVNDNESTLSMKPKQIFTNHIVTNLKATTVDYPMLSCRTRSQPCYCKRASSQLSNHLCINQCPTCILSPTTSIDSMESHNLSAPSSDCMNNDAIIPISETTDSPSVNSHFIFAHIRPNRQDETKTNNKNKNTKSKVACTHQTVTAL